MADITNIDFNDFRKQYQIPAASARAILDKLGYRVEKVDGVTKIIGGSVNTYGKGDEYMLKHAVLEFRRTMDIVNTMSGNFFEYKEEAEIKGKKVVTEYGVSKLDADAIRPKTPSLKRAPNAQSSALIPVETETSPLAAAAPEALSALVAALTQAQASAAPKDPLMPQKQLKEAEREGYRITTHQLAELLGMSPQTISSKKSGFIRLGFTFEKIKEGASTLWKVRQID